MNQRQLLCRSVQEKLSLGKIEYARILVKSVAHPLEEQKPWWG